MRVRVVITVSLNFSVGFAQRIRGRAHEVAFVVWRPVFDGQVDDLLELIDPLLGHVVLIAVHIHEHLVVREGAHSVVHVLDLFGPVANGPGKGLLQQEIYVVSFALF